MIVIRNYHKNSWKLHDCHKRPASLKNKTLAYFCMGRMGRMGRMGHIGRMFMGQEDKGTMMGRSHHALRTTHQRH